jgi:hypothetical protein
MIKVKSDKKLFEKILTLGDRIKAQASYVQNDMELTEDDIKEYLRMSNAHIKDLGDIKSEMLVHIRRCNE